MPTGYTADLMEKGMEFKPFVLQCARAFGALITMRDDSLDAPIPEKFEPDDYHIKKLAEAIQEQKRLQSMTDDEKVSFGIQAREENIVSHQKKSCNSNSRERASNRNDSSSKGMETTDARP